MMDFYVPGIVIGMRESKSELDIVLTFKAHRILVEYRLINLRAAGL